MQHEDILELLDKGHGFTAVKVNIEACEDRLTSAEDVEALISSMPSETHGWIARQSGVIVLPGPDDRNLGAVLEAELGTTKETLQIRRIGPEWVWTRFIEVEGEGETNLAEDVLLVTVEGRAARYRRYWTLPEDGAAEVVACRLIGLEDMP